MDDLMTIMCLVAVGSSEGLQEAHRLFSKWAKFQVLASGETSAWEIFLLPRRHRHSSFNDCTVRSLAKTLNDIRTGDWQAVGAVAGGSGHEEECHGDSKSGLWHPHLSCCQVLRGLKRKAAFDFCTWPVLPQNWTHNCLIWAEVKC